MTCHVCCKSTPYWVKSPPNFEGEFLVLTPDGWQFLVESRVLNPNRDHYDPPEVVIKGGIWTEEVSVKSPSLDDCLWQLVRTGWDF